MDPFAAFAYFGFPISVLLLVWGGVWLHMRSAPSFEDVYKAAQEVNPARLDGRRARAETLRDLAEAEGRLADAMRQLADAEDRIRENDDPA
jgi:hypothetical protein